MARFPDAFAIAALLGLTSSCGGQSVTPAAQSPVSVIVGASAPQSTPTAASAPAAAAFPVAPRASVTQLAAQGDATCARLADGSVRCWGDNRFNVISNDPPVGRNEAIKRPKTIPNLPPVAEVVLGASYGCARMSDATVRCWGTDDGDLGLGTPLPPGPPAHTDTPMPVLGLGNVASLSGRGHLCALLTDATVACWADYDRGNGDPRDAGSRAPVAVPGFANAVQIADGGILSCARFAKGQVRCWRDVSPGLIPRGKVRVDPVSVAVKDVVSIAAGSDGACAITTMGGVSCWGQVPFAQGSTDLTVAYPIPGLRDVVAIALGDDMGCVITRGGGVVCDDASDYHKAHSPAQVAGVSGAVEIVAGAAHACARTSSGDVLCWGRNDHGQLGDGTETSRVGAAPVVW